MAHIHPIIDSDFHFEINKVTRAVSSSAEKLRLVQFDHNSERATYSLPRYIEGHDMLECNLVEVHYINIEKSTHAQNEGVYIVDDLAETDDAEKITCSWLISNNATQYVGSLNFVIRFACVSKDAEGVVTTDYVWQTARNSEIEITDGIYNGEVIAEEYADILAQWEARIQALEQGGAGGSSHEHENKNTLDGFYCEASEYVPPVGDFPIGDNTVKSDRLTFGDKQIRYCSDGQVIAQVEESDTEIILTLADSANLSGTLETSQVTIPLGVTQSDMETYVTKAINGSLDEIETMIDESGVLDE